MSDETSTTIDDYDSQAERYAACLGCASLDHEIDQFAAMLPPAAWIVDSGAGPGRYTLALAQRGLNVVALDLSSGLLRAGVELGVKHSVLADMRRLPFAAGVLDGVWACASLLHLQQSSMPRVLAEMRRTVCSGGVAFISVKQGQGTEWVTSPGGGRRFFTYYQPDVLDVLLTDAGWQIVDGKLSPDTTRAGLSWIVRFCRAG